MKRKDRKPNSALLAALKTLGTKYSVFSEMCEQSELLCFEFETEINAVLDLACTELQKTAPAQAGNEQIKKHSESQELVQQDSDPQCSDESLGADESVPPSKSGDQPPWLRQLFKRIAIHCHPDKVSSSDHKKMLLYMTARKALDESDLALMISVGLTFNEIPDIPVAETKKIMSEAVKEFEDRIESRQTSISWTWGMSELNFEIKSEILILAAKQLRFIDLGQENAMKALNLFFEVDKSTGDIVARRGKSTRKPGTRPEKLRDIRNKGIK